MGLVDGRVVIVTGAGGGIGRAHALAFAAEGARVVVNDIGVGLDGSPAGGGSAAQSVVDEITSAGGEAVTSGANVADWAQAEGLIQTAVDSFGGLDVLVNNAGIAPRIRADVLDASEESFDELMATNLRGPYFLTQSVAAWMIRQPGQPRSIINISSVSATVASVNRGDYCISKAGIAMATKLWAARLAEYGIGVYEIRPGIIETDMTEGVKGKYDALIEGGILLEKRWGTPEDIGSAASMLARGELPYATGAVLVLDGGLTLARL
jgi:3-oxoacyl-[acyl-carrier protein] reductase